MRSLVFRAPFLCALSALAVRPAAAQIASPPVGAHAFKLSGSLAQPGTGDVLDFALAADGSWIVYRADAEADGVWEIFAAPLDGGAPAVRLNDPLPPGGNVGGYAINVFGAGGQQDYVIAPGGRVVYIADAFADGQDELFSVPADRGEAPVHLSAGVPFGMVRTYAVSADGQLVVFLAGTNETSAFYRVPTDGSEPATAFTEHSQKGWTWWLAPDGSRVLYTEPFSFDRTSLYRSPVDGSQPPALVAQSRPPDTFGFSGFTRAFFSDDGVRVLVEEVVEADGLGPERSDVLSATLDGSSPPLQLNQQPLDLYQRAIAYAGGSRVAFLSYGEGGIVTIGLDGSSRIVLGGAPWQPLGTVLLSKDGSKVVFTAAGNGTRAVLVGPLDGSTPAQQLAGTSGSLGITGVTSTRVVYSSFTTTAVLHAVPLAGGASVLLNPPPHVLGGATALHPGGGHVLYSADRSGSGVIELFRAPLDGSTAPERLSDPLPPSADVGRIAVAGGGAHVVYMADRNENETFEIYGAPFEGGPDVQYNAPLPQGPVLGDVDAFWVAAGEERVVYRADQDEDAIPGLFAGRVDGGAAPISLTQGLPEGRAVFDALALTPDGTRAAFLRANSPGSAAGILYSSDTTQAGAPKVLDSANGLHETPLLASSTRVAYRRRESLFGPYQLCSARLDGTGTPLALSPPTGTVSLFRLSPDGATAFYLAPLDSAGVIELYRVPMDGSAPSAKLNPPLAGELDVSAFSVSPTGAHVAYLADQDVDQRLELYVAPSDASAPAAKLNASLPAGGNVSDFLFAPDGQHVVYRSDQDVDGSVELYRVPIGGGTPLRLTPFATPRVVQADYALSADGQSLYYRAAHGAGPVLELWRVPADGSAAPARLSGTLVAGGNVGSFALAPDGTRVAYVADQRTDDVLELFSAGTAPGTDVLLLGMPATGDVMQARVAPDSASAVCRADVADGVFELFEVALDGSSPARRLCPPLPTGGDVETDFVALSRGRALYRAEHEENNVVELWRSSFGPRVRSAKPR